MPRLSTLAQDGPSQPSSLSYGVGGSGLPLQSLSRGTHQFGHQTTFGTRSPSSPG